jgi:hypothetical protein
MAKSSASHHVGLYVTLEIQFGTRGTTAASMHDELGLKTTGDERA